MAVILRKGSSTVQSVFELLGSNENDMTAAMGFALSRCPNLLARLLNEVVEYQGSTDKARILLQSTSGTEGITDVLVELPPEVTVVIEAKRGHHLPSSAQLAKYVPALQGSSRVALVALTHASEQFAHDHLPREVAGVSVRHMSWNRLHELVIEARSGERQRARYILEEFATYLEGLIHMDTRYSNMTYVVSLGAGYPEGWTLSWIDVVERNRHYFYPVGKNWPDPPNYIAFRYHGKLQSIHHVQGADVFTNPRTIFPEAPDEEWPQHYCLRLGQPIHPPHEVRTGSRVVRAARVWCMLDTLFTCDTLSEALTETEKRKAP